MDKKKNKKLSKSSKSEDARESTNTSQSAPVFRIKVWGARGSLPAPASPDSLDKQIREILLEFLEWNGRRKGNGKSEKAGLDVIDKFCLETPRHKLGGYGGNTPCVEVKSPGQQLIIDAGSGIRNLGYELMAGPCGKGQGEVHILFTHFHWDHLIGLPFFTPLFIPGNKIHVYSVQPDLKNVFQMLFKKPYFPVPFERLAAKIEFHTLLPRVSRPFGDIQVTPYELDHPDPCWGYKMVSGGKAFSHCVDTECVRVLPRELGPDLPLYQGVDLMLFDAQYTLMETIDKVNWGHATASLGLDIAMRERVKRMVFIHHDPASTNDKIAAAEKQARVYYQNQLKHAREVEPVLYEVDWQFGYEGMILEV